MKEQVVIFSNNRGSRQHFIFMLTYGNPSNKKTTMCRRFVLVFCLISLLTSIYSTSNAQLPQSGIIKDWQILGESSKRIDVFYRLVNCDSTNQIHLKIMNENVIDQHLDFQVRVVNNANRDYFTKEIGVDILKTQTIKAECAVTNLPDLKIDLPGSYSPLQTAVLVIFNP